MKRFVLLFIVCIGVVGSDGVGAPFFLSRVFLVEKPTPSIKWNWYHFLVVKMVPVNVHIRCCPSQPGILA